MRWVERVGRRAVVMPPLLAAAIAASLPAAPAKQADLAMAAEAAVSAVWGPVRSAAVSDTMPVSVPAGVSSLVGGEALTAVGQLLADNGSCTAVVVASSSGRLAVTAAHCVYVPATTERMPDVADGRAPGWVDEVVFVPARSGEDAPYGVWSVERMWVDRAWQDDAAPEVDVAFLQLRDTPSGTAQEVLGALGLRFGPAADAVAQADAERPGTRQGDAGPTVDVLGHPTAVPFDGTRLRSCDQVATDAGHPGLVEARCGLTQGASGGPWVVPDRGWWSVIAVTSYLSRDRPGALGGARLGAMAERLWRTADRAARQ